MTRLSTTCCNCTRSPETGERSSANCVRMATLFFFASSPTRASTSRIVSFRSSSSSLGASPCRQGPNAGDHFTGSLPVTNDVADSFTGLVQLGASPASQRRQALPLLTMPVSGWLTSCAIEAASSPIMLTRLMCARSASSCRTLTLFFGPLAVGDVSRTRDTLTVAPCSSNVRTRTCHRIPRFRPFGDAESRRHRRLLSGRLPIDCARRLREHSGPASGTSVPTVPHGVTETLAGRPVHVNNCSTVIASMHEERVGAWSESPEARFHSREAFLRRACDLGCL